MISDSCPQWKTGRAHSLPRLRGRSGWGRAGRKTSYFIGRRTDSAAGLCQSNPAFPYLPLRHPEPQGTAKCVIYAERSVEAKKSEDSCKEPRAFVHGFPSRSPCRVVLRVVRDNPDDSEGYQARITRTPAQRIEYLVQALCAKELSKRRSSPRRQRTDARSDLSDNAEKDEPAVFATNNVCARGTDKNGRRRPPLSTLTANRCPLLLPFLTNSTSPKRRSCGACRGSSAAIQARSVGEPQGDGIRMIRNPMPLLLLRD